MIRLITGYAGVGHVTSADAGRFNAGVCGRGAYVMQTGDMFAYTLKSNNEIEIGSGDLVKQGRHFSIPQNSTETLLLENGLQGKARYDTIAIRYNKNPDTGVESADIHVIKGDEVIKTSTPPLPACVDGDIFAGAITCDIPLYNIKITDLAIEKVELACSIIPSLSSITDVIYPVGAIYISMNDTSPSDLFGGEWERVTDCFLFATANKSGVAGGNRMTTLSTDNLPSHTHKISPHTHSIPRHTHQAEAKEGGTHTHNISALKTAASGTARYEPASAGALSNVATTNVNTNRAGGHTHSITIGKSDSSETGEAELTTNAAGKGKEFSNMPPYLTVYMWRRTK